LHPFKQPNSSNQTQWKLTFRTKTVGKNLTFAMMNKKVKTSFGGGPKRAKTTDFGGILRFKPVFCQSASTHQSHHTCRKAVFGCFSTSH